MTKSSEKTLWDIAIENAKENQKTQGISEELSVLFLGSKTCGKTQLILRYLDKDETAKPTTALEYTYVRKGKGQSMAKDVGHIWELGGGTWLSQLIEVVANPDTIKSTHIYLMLDLSKPEEMWFTLEKLLTAIRSRVDAVVSQIPGLKDALTQKAFERYGENSLDKEVVNPLLVPLIIVGGKYDLFQEIEPEKRKVISKTLRYIAHYSGASLLYFSSKIEPLIGRMRQIVTHSLFSTSPPKGTYTDHGKPILILAGQDSMENIGPPPLPEGDLGRITAKTPMDMWKAAFSSYFPQTDVTDPALVEDPAKDSQYAEPSIDTMRMQKDEELERYKRMVERRQKDKNQIGGF
ncbi:DgyrCDS13814 [Dimorphilus gyrociliatus]|uniref:Cytoplasmic dynein 2 light intermediate chain 1 n=1 Tax=Dimorphilus gyrociliatus TaxID=2664684 RepID=A0A7I8WBS9_9ANNE|nr:DgyrCDS13814 [Dimorphilus gyrociliatus]